VGAAPSKNTPTSVDPSPTLLSKKKEKKKENIGLMSLYIILPRRDNKCFFIMEIA
jgi:hypothetical protein